MITVSVVISAYNEEKNLQDCLKSVKNLADEIILVNSGSTDKTTAIAEKYRAKIYDRPNNLMLNINKNFGFTKVSGEWILNLDADERVTPELRDEIEQVLQYRHSGLSRIDSGVANVHQNDGDINGFWLPRKNMIFGKWIKSEMWWPDYQLRLFRNGQGRFPEKHIHEKIEVKGETARLKNHLIHANYSSISQFLYKMDRIYTENEAEVFLKSGKKINWTDSLKWPIADFLKTFFVQEGYKDGLHGLVLSFLQAFYAEITFVKIWERQGFREEELGLEKINREFQKSGKEINYWLWESKTREAKGIKKLLFKIARKIF